MQTYKDTLSERNVRSWQDWLLILLAGAGLALGLVFHWRLNDGPMIWPWALISCVLWLLLLFNKTQWLTNWLISALKSSPWPWLVVAVVLNSLVLLVGHTEMGATRWYGNESFSIRASLISLIPLLMFLTIFSQQTKASDIEHLLALVGMTIYALASFLQPDLVSLVLLFILAIYFSLSARNLMRIWLAVSAGLGLSLGAFYALSEPYRWERLTSFLIQSDPEGIGQTLNLTQSAFEQAGWWGSEKEHLIQQATRWIELEWSALPHMALWTGQLGLVLCLISIVVFLAVYFAQALKSLAPVKHLLIGDWLLFAVSQVFAILPSFGLLPYTGHYGLLWVSMNEITISAFLGLLLLSTSTTLPDLKSEYTTLNSL